MWPFDDLLLELIFGSFVLAIVFFFLNRTRWGSLSYVGFWPGLALTK